MAQFCSLSSQKCLPGHRCRKATCQQVWLLPPTSRVRSRQLPRHPQAPQALPEVITQLPRDTLLAGGAAAVAALSGIAGGVWWLNNGQLDHHSSNQMQQHRNGARKPARKDAVVVLGASGKTGKQVVAELLQAGRTVVAAGRDSEKVKSALHELGLEEGSTHGGILAFEGGIDIANAGSLSNGLWEGVEQVVIAVGPTYSKSENGFTNTSQEVDAEGVKHVVEALQRKFSQQERTSRQVVLPLRSEADLRKWDRLDDVIMGGQSESKLKLGEARTASWEGILRVEGGGFCGCRAKGLKLDLSPYDGLSLKVKGDGQTFKVNLKTADQEDKDESTYQATFDTTDGEWTTVDLPWTQFVPVRRASVDPTAPPLNPNSIVQLGLVLSRFEFNGAPNAHFKAGSYSLQIQDGFSAYKAPRPRLLLVSSAATERNARIADDQAARKADIPIVQLNPGGVLNYKYEGETAVRTSGLPYTVLKPVGLTADKDMKPGVLEYSQGDRISGKILRSEVAHIVAAALKSPAAVGKTLEVRRSEAADAGSYAPDVQQLQLQFIPLTQDRLRPRIGLTPFPAPSPPPPPPSKERTDEILADPRVQAAARRNVQPAASNSSSSATEDKPPQEAKPVQPQESDKKPPSEAGNAGSDASRKDLDAEESRSQTGDSSQLGAGQGGDGKAPNAKEAKEWIGDWRQKSGQSGLE